MSDPLPLATTPPLAWAALVVAAIRPAPNPGPPGPPPGDDRRAPPAHNPTRPPAGSPTWAPPSAATPPPLARGRRGRRRPAGRPAHRVGGPGRHAAAPLAPVLSPIPLAAAVALPVLASRAERRRQAAAVIDQLPDVVDLLALTTAAGLPVTAAVSAIAGRPGGPLGAALSRAAGHVHHGGCLADALGHLARAGPPVRPLADALAHHDRYGSPLLPALERVGIEARARAGARPRKPPPPARHPPLPAGAHDVPRVRGADGRPAAGGIARLPEPVNPPLSRDPTPMRSHHPSRPAPPAAPAPDTTGARPPPSTPW